LSGVALRLAQAKNIGSPSVRPPRRYGCDGELQWIDATPEYRGKSVAAELIALLAKWFAEQSASKVCVNVAPKDITASLAGVE
jgi:GNAT superfamily N-acetyltransferase